MDPKEIQKAEREIARVEAHLAKLKSQGVTRENGVYAIYEDLLTDLKNFVEKRRK